MRGVSGVAGGHPFSSCHMTIGRLVESKIWRVQCQRYTWLPPADRAREVASQLTQRDDFSVLSFKYLVCASASRVLPQQSYQETM